MKNIIIIGASHAAAEAIAALRKAGWEQKITLIGDEAVLPYQRPPLSKGYYQGQVAMEKLAIKKPSFYETSQVDLLLGRRVESIDRKNKQVLLDDETSVSYDKLIIATGTRARYLNVQGGDLPQVKYLRTVADVDAIKQQLEGQSKLLIVGAGYIGLEVAASAVKQGLKVTVLETMDRVLARVTSPVVSTFYQEIHTQAGVDIRLDAGLSRFEETANGARAILADGQALEFDCAIVGIGVIPNIELAQEAGLSCDNGVLVDEYACTDDPDIYAVGDCSNHPSFIYDRRIRLESVPNAVAQAKAAALAICGEPIAYDQVPWFWSDQYDVKLQTVGLLSGYDEMVVRGDPASRKFAVFYLQEGQLLAVDAINSPGDFIKAKKMVTSKAKLDRAKLQDVNVDYSKE